MKWTLHYWIQSLHITDLINLGRKGILDQALEKTDYMRYWYGRKIHLQKYLVEVNVHENYISMHTGRKLTHTGYI